jgi:beta-lactamase regulating signal transducer with metallopeptidase domain
MGFSTELGAFLEILGTHAGLSGFSRTAAATLLTEVWQGLAVVLCLGLCLRLAPRTTAAHRFALWTGGFLAVAALPFAPFLAHLVSGNAPGTDAQVMSASSRPWLLLDTCWSIALTALWACASLWRASDLAVNSVRLRKLWKSATPVSFHASLPGVLDLRGRRTVQLCTTRDLERPSVIGFLAPRILIPEWLLERLTPAELDQIVLHETEHLRRGDDWTNLLQKLSLVLFPLSPALLWMERRLCLEREMACDEGVIQRTHAPRAYAACLTSLAERGQQHRTHALSLGVWQRRPELARRVHSILLRKQALGPVAARSLMAVLGCIVLAGSVELARCPQMIAFLPDSTASYQPVMLADDNHLAGDRVLMPALQTVAGHAQGRPYLTELKATLPVRKPFLTRYPAGSKVPAASADALAASARRSFPAPKEELLKADLSTPQADPETDASDSGTQRGTQWVAQGGWVVLTTWEQVETVQANNQDFADGEAAVQSSDSVHGQDPNQSSGQLTITRLIFRVVRASATSPLPTAVPLRSGWLVFQL